MTRAHIPPGFVSISADYSICDDGYIRLYYGADDGDYRYSIQVFALERGEAFAIGPTFTKARADVYRILRDRYPDYPETLAEAKRVLGPKPKPKPKPKGEV